MFDVCIVSIKVDFKEEGYDEINQEPLFSIKNYFKLLVMM